MLKLWIPFIALISSISINYLYPKLQGTSIGYVNKDKKIDISPSKYAFSIWGIIYLGLIILTLLKPNWSSNSINFFIISCIFNALWIIVWTSMPEKPLNIYLGNVMLPLIVISLLFFWNENLTSKLDNKSLRFNNIIFQNIIALYLSWCIGATLLNTGISLKSFISDNNINYFVIISLCLINIFWQIYGYVFSSSSSFMKDSLAVPVVGLWTSIAIYNNGKTQKLGLISSLITGLCIIFNLYNIK